MSATGKVLAAAALVAAGFGVARLTGEPALKSIVAPSATIAQRASLQAPSSPTESRNGGMRLVPDFTSVELANPFVQPKNKVAPELWLKPSVETKRGEVVTKVETRSEEVAPLAALSPPPRATLRNEAPRPLDFNQRSANSPSSPPEQVASSAMGRTAHFAEQPATPPSWPTNQTVMKQYENEPMSAPAITASYTEPDESLAGKSSITPIGPPPWPAPEDAGPRKHIVVDGDSLARLAGRYLDDPHRGSEIFEANRGVLTDPELLPIGAELVIPSRNPAAALSNSPQSFQQRTVAIYSPANARLVPVSPVPSAASVAPRAQLMRPLPVD